MAGRQDNPHLALARDVQFGALQAGQAKGCPHCGHHLALSGAGGLQRLPLRRRHPSQRARPRPHRRGADVEG